MAALLRGDNLSKKDKKLQDIRNNPRNVRFDALQNLLLDYDFKISTPSGGSSHYTFSSGIYRITVPKENPVNQIYVKKVIKIIDELNKENDDE